jgi:FKBP-type peptidyl-prolyl cis-trans isomerase 2
MERFIMVPPLKGYGIPNRDLIHVVSRMERTSRFQHIPVETFRSDIGLEPEVGVVYNLSRENSTLIWPITVINASDDMVYYRHEPPLGSWIHPIFGRVDVETAEDELLITVNPAVGDVVTPYGIGRITDVNEENFTIDYNHWLAGKTLLVTVQLTNIEPF